MRKMSLLLEAVLLLAAALGLEAGVVGSQFQINSYTTGEQAFPEVDVDANGDFVVVWRSDGSSGSDTSFYSIQAQRYTSDGSLKGSQFQVNTLTTNSQRRPAVGLDADGDFVVVWQSDVSVGNDTSFQSIQGQRYASDGSTRGGQFQVNTYTTDGQYWPMVGVAADGDFVVTWWSYGSVGSDSSLRSIQAQRYASDGTAQGTQFQVNTYSTGFQDEAAIAMGSDGGFIVVWRGPSSQNPLGGIQAQRFASDGARLGGEMQIDTGSFGARRPAIGIAADGDFVIAWDRPGVVDSDIDVRRFASDGTPQGDQFQVNTYTINQQIYADIGVAGSGAFTVAWQSDGSSDSDTSSFGVQARRYFSNGAPREGQFQVNAYTIGAQQRPALGLVADGNFVAVWRSDGSYGSDSSGSSIQGQRFFALLFSDGFESGSTAAWTSALGSRNVY